MFERIRIYFACKKATKPLSIMMKRTVDLLSALGIGSSNVEYYHLGYLLAWYNVLYSHLFNNSKSLQLGVVFLLQNHLLNTGNSPEDVEEILSIRKKYTIEIQSKVEFAFNSPAFFPIMAETAKNFFMDYGEVDMSDDDCFSVILRYEQLFISQFKNRKRW